MQLWQVVDYIKAQKWNEFKEASCMIGWPVKYIKLQSPTRPFPWSLFKWFNEKDNFFQSPWFGVLCKNDIDFFFPIFNKSALHSQIQDGDQVTFSG